MKSETATGSITKNMWTHNSSLGLQLSEDPVSCKA